MIFDFVGRLSPKFFSIPFAALTLVIWLRVGFFVLFILMAWKTPIIQNDIVAFIAMTVFALTNGYCCSLSMIYGPQEVETHEKQSAGTIMVSLFFTFRRKSITNDYSVPLSQSWNILWSDVCFPSSLFYQRRRSLDFIKEGNRIIYLTDMI